MFYFLTFTPDLSLDKWEKKMNAQMMEIIFIFVLFFFFFKLLFLVICEEL